MKARIPLQVYEGIDSPLPLVALRVRDRWGTEAPVLFRVDTAADVTSLPVAVARRENIGFSTQRQGVARGMVGSTRKYRDRVQLVIAGRVHDWPCDFVEVAEAPPRSLLMTTGVLGRAGFLDEFACAIDDGFLIITRLGPVRRFVRRCLHRWWQLTGQIRDANEPL